MIQPGLIVGDPSISPVPHACPEPESVDVIARLRRKLLAERARSLRLAQYIDEVLDADPPADDEAVSGWEAGDFVAFWAQEAEKSLSDDAWWRRASPGESTGAAMVLLPGAR